MDCQSLFFSENELVPVKTENALCRFFRVSCLLLVQRQRDQAIKYL